MSSSVEAAELKLHEQLQLDPNSPLVAHLKIKIEELKLQELLQRDPNSPLVAHLKVIIEELRLQEQLRLDPNSALVAYLKENIKELKAKKDREELKAKEERVHEELKAKEERDHEEQLRRDEKGTKLLRVVEFIFLAAFLAVGCFIFVRQEAPVTGSLQAWVLFKMLFAPLSTIIFNIDSLYRSELANWLHRVQQRLRGGYTMVQGGSWTR